MPVHGDAVNFTRSLVFRVSTPGPALQHPDLEERTI